MSGFITKLQCDVIWFVLRYRWQQWKLSISLVNDESEGSPAFDLGHYGTRTVEWEINDKVCDGEAVIGSALQLVPAVDFSDLFSLFQGFTEIDVSGLLWPVFDEHDRCCELVEKWRNIQGLRPKRFPWSFIVSPSYVELIYAALHWILPRGHTCYKCDGQGVLYSKRPSLLFFQSF